MSRTCAIYLRQSKASAEGIERQRERTTALATARGWTVVDEFIDDDVSASKPRGIDTGWGRMLHEASVGRLDIVVAVDLDRLLRSTRDLNTLIDAGLSAVTVDGEIDLTTADGEFRATMLAGIARFEVRRKGERQQRAAAQRAESGRFARGTRLTGYTPDGEIVAEEAAVVREIFDRFNAGESLTAIAAWLQAGALPTRSGNRWLPTTVRRMLLNPRYCGRQTYRRQPTGAMGTWTPIIAEVVFDTAQIILDDPRRNVRGGATTGRKYLGSGIYRCGEAGCGERVSSHTGGSTPTGSYACQWTHLTRVRGPVDDYVRQFTSDWLRAIADDLDLSPASNDRPDELAALRARLAQVEQDYDNDLIDARRYAVKRSKIQSEIESAASRQARGRAQSALASVVTEADPGDAFMTAPLGIQRTIIDEFLSVTLLRGKRGGYRSFDPASVEILPRHPEDGTP